MTTHFRKGLDPTPLLIDRGTITRDNMKTVQFDNVTKAQLLESQIKAKLDQNVLDQKVENNM